MNMYECNFSTVYDKKILQTQSENATICICEKIAECPRRLLLERFHYKDDVINTVPSFVLSKWSKCNHVTKGRNIRSRSQSRGRSKYECKYNTGQDCFKHLYDHKKFMEEYRARNTKVVVGDGGETGSNVVLGVNVPDPYFFKTEYFRDLCNRALEDFYNSGQNPRHLRRISLPSPIKEGNNTGLSTFKEENNTGLSTFQPTGEHGSKNRVVSAQIHAVEELRANMERLAKGLAQTDLKHEFTRRGIPKTDLLPDLTSRSLEHFAKSKSDWSRKGEGRLLTAKSAPGGLSSGMTRSKSLKKSGIRQNSSFRFDGKFEFLEDERKRRKKRLELENKLVNRPNTCAGCEIERGLEQKLKTHRLKHINLTGKSSRERKKITSGNAVP